MNCCGGNHGRGNSQNYNNNQRFNNGHNAAEHGRSTNSKIEFIMAIGAVLIAGIALYFLR